MDVARAAFIDIDDVSGAEAARALFLAPPATQGRRRASRKFQINELNAMALKRPQRSQQRAEKHHHVRVAWLHAMRRSLALPGGCVLEERLLLLPADRRRYSLLQSGFIFPKSTSFSSRSRILRHATRTTREREQAGQHTQGAGSPPCCVRPPVERCSSC